MLTSQSLSGYTFGDPGNLAWAEHFETDVIND